MGLCLAPPAPCRSPGLFRLPRTSTAASFTGNYGITIGGGSGTVLTVNTQGNANSATINNTLIAGQTLTINGRDIANAEASANVKPLIFAGTGETFVTGTGIIQNGGNGLGVQLDTSGTVRLGGSGTSAFASGLTLNQGTSIIEKSGALNPLGTSASNFAANGGVLQASLDLIGGTRAAKRDRASCQCGYLQRKLLHGV